MTDPTSSTLTVVPAPHPTDDPVRAGSGGWSSSTLRVDVSADGERAVVRPAGELDLATAADVDRALADVRATGFDDVTLDLARLTLVDSSGIGALLTWSLRAAAEGWVLRVLPARADVERVIALAGLRPVLDGAEPVRDRVAGPATVRALHGRMSGRAPVAG